MLCNQCGKETNNPKFCSKSCAASFNNKGVRRNGNPVIKQCLNCGKDFQVSRNSTGKYCSLTCSSEGRKEQFIENWLKNPESTKTIYSNSSAIRGYILKEQKGLCAVCSIKSEWKGKPLSFVLDHIDGNSDNNARENLRLICSNCDSQLDTYKGKNAGKGRWLRRQRYKEGKSF